MKILLIVAIFCSFLVIGKIASYFDINLENRTIHNIPQLWSLKFNEQNVNAEEGGTTPKTEQTTEQQPEKDTFPRPDGGKIHNQIDKSQLMAGYKSVTESEYLILQKLSERRKELEQFEKELIDKEQYLSSYNNKLQSKIDEIQNMIKKLEDLLIDYDESNKQKIANLVKIYENMKPRDAAEIFEELDLDILLQVVSKMKQSKAATILAQMNPRKAKDLTLALAKYKTLSEIPCINLTKN